MCNELNLLHELCAAHSGAFKAAKSKRNIIFPCKWNKTGVLFELYIFSLYRYRGCLRNLFKRCTFTAVQIHVGERIIQESIYERSIFILYTLERPQEIYKPDEKYECAIYIERDISDVLFLSGSSAARSSSWICRAVYHQRTIQVLSRLVSRTTIYIYILGGCADPPRKKFRIVRRLAFSPRGLKASLKFPSIYIYRYIGKSMSE